ncbi:MAG: 2,3-diphosphoglycerate-dependent phosphoglycerate mutase [Mariniphaga sp.]|jgi:2,3-bisphosphoglycerate-dependent phosphoglycerate mutase|nr:2,3-diphosphoglycerate-dependent phosphoglycerate mutase [Mariniphaga sp.]
MHKLVLLRHGESQWNKENLFTGWTDVGLSEKGIEEAKEAGKILAEHDYKFDFAFVSLLKRALQTLWYTLEVMDQLWIPWAKSWRLNERHYGGLQGLNKKEMAKKYGDDQVHQWRRSYTVRPPQLEKSDKRYPGNDRKYHNLLEQELPLGESLEDTVERFIPYWKGMIAPTLQAGRQVIIAAHGNSLRALVKHLQKIPDDEINALEIPTGKPLIYELDDSLLYRNHYYL